NATKPYLFWKSVEEPARIPDSLDQVRDRVVYAWKFQKARELARARAKELAEALRKAKGDVTPILREEAARLAAREVNPEKVAPLRAPGGLAPGGDAPEVLELKNVAPLESKLEARLSPFGAFQTYKVPADKFAYPRKDTVEQILAMKEPGKEVQVLANQ